MAGRAEWAQDHKNLAKKKLGRLINGELQAFRRDDFIFYGADGTRIAQSDKVILDENDPKIGRIDCQWRYQKNGDNGQQKSQSRNLKTPDRYESVGGVKHVAQSHQRTQWQFLLTPRACRNTLQTTKSTHTYKKWPRPSTRSRIQ
eukprot:scaffold239064_cov26-Attheya_sp.AAC.1